MGVLKARVGDDWVPIQYGVSYATDAETIAGTVTDKAVTPASLDAVLDVRAVGIPAASDAETIAGTVTDKAVTPASLKYERPYFDVRSFGAVGDGTTDDTATIQAAIDAATAAGGGIVMFPKGTYRITASLSMLEKTGVHLRGVALAVSIIRQDTLTVPIIKLSGAYQGIHDLQLRYAAPSSTAGADALQLDALTRYGVFENLYLWNCHTGINLNGVTTPRGEFSNVWSNIRIGPFSAQALRIFATTAQGTGSAWTNIYVNNASGSVAGVCTDYPVQLTNHGGVFNQLNVEWCNTVAAAKDLVFFQQCHGVVVNRLHMEGNALPASRGFITTFNAETTVQINGLNLFNNVAASGSIGIVRPGAGTHMLLTTVEVDNNTSIAANFYVIFDTGVGTGAVVTVDNVLDPDNHLDGFSTGYPGTAFARGYKGATLGFYGATPVAKPTSVTPKAALESLGLGSSLIDAPYIDVRSYGAVGNGVADDTAAIQAAINSVALGAGVPAVTIEFGPGVFNISNTLTIERRAVILRGAGIGNQANMVNPGKGTTIKWVGAAGLPMVRYVDSRHTGMFDIHLCGDDTNPPSAGVYIEGAGGSIGTNENMVFERVLFGYLPWHVSGYQMDWCVHVGGAVNANNDQFFFRNCQFQRPTTGCVRIDNTQSIWGSFEDCTFDANTGTAKGISTSATVMLYNAQFNACNPDIEINSTAQVTVSGYHSENARKLAAITAGGGRLIVRGGLCQLSQIAGGYYLTADVLAGGCVDLDGFKIMTGTASPRPKLRVIGASMSGALAGATSVVSVRNCSTLPGDYEISSLANGRVQVMIDDMQIFDRSYITGAVTYAVPAIGSRVGNDLEIEGALNHDGTTVGFYGGTPVAKQAGVAVTAAGIHAALVNLGLISA